MTKKPLLKDWYSVKDVINRHKDLTELSLKFILDMFFNGEIKLYFHVYDLDFTIYGDIGQYNDEHHYILNFSEFDEKKRIFYEVDEIENLEDYDYFVVSLSETGKSFDFYSLDELNEMVKNPKDSHEEEIKTMIVEDSMSSMLPDTRIKIYTLEGYSPIQGELDRAKYGRVG